MNKNAFNPACLFNFVWLLILVFRSMNLYGLYDYSEETIDFFVIGIILFNFGVAACSLTSKPKKGVQKTMNFMFYLFTFITIALLSYTSINSALLLAKGQSISSIRYWLRDEILNNDFVSVLYNYFCYPMTFLIVHICIYRLFVKKHKIRYLLLAGFVVVASVLTEGGRFILLYVGIDVIMMTLITKRYKMLDNKMKRKMKPIIAISVFTMIAGFIYITVARNADIFKTIYTYMCGCVNFFDAKISRFNGDYYYGLVSLHGFIRPIFTLLRSIGIISSLPTFLEGAGNVLLDVEKFTFISPEVQYNGFITNFYAFYVDGGLFGIVLFSLIYGFACQKIFRKMSANKDEFSIVLYLFIAQALASSMLKFQFVAFNYSLGLVYFLFSYIPIGKSKHHETTLCCTRTSGVCE